MNKAQKKRKILNTANISVLFEMSKTVVSMEPR